MGERRGISQETLKLIACITMLIDHIGAVLIPYNMNLRIIGRLSFPIYCFLLAEGCHYTHNSRQYALRLGIFMLLSELPFDLAFSGGVDWSDQNVMVTMLLGFLLLETLKYCRYPILKVIALLPFAFAADKLCTDYGGYGVTLIWVFGVFRGNKLLCLLGSIIVCYIMNSVRIWFLGVRIPIEMFAVFALIPIWFYSGEKLTRSKVAQWAFYAFYPVHLTILWLISCL